MSVDTRAPAACAATTTAKPISAIALFIGSARDAAWGIDSETNGHLSCTHQEAGMIPHRTNTVSRWIERMASATLLTLVCSSAALAQSAIAGEVRDSSGAVLPGVSVEAASPALIEGSRAVVTDGSGAYRIENLRPGEYTVTFSLTGFRTVKREGISLPTSFTAQVNAELSLGQLQESVTGTGESPLVDVRGSVSQSVMTRARVDTIPTARGSVA